MAGDAGKTGTDQSTDKPSIGFSLPFAERAPANPMEVMAAATAAGMALSTQFASAFFGMMQAAMEATAKPSVAAQPKAPEAPVQPIVKAAEPVKVEMVPAPVVAKAAAPEAKPSVATKPAEKPVAKVAKPKPAAKVAAVPAEKPAAKAEPVAKAKPKVGPKAEKPAKPVKAEKAAVAPVATQPVAVAAKPQPRKKAAKAADDLKKISGIGPKLAEMLGGMGVTRFAQIAAWTDKDVEHVDRELGLDGRIAKDNWIAQAKALLR
ncbi:5' DNA nuclease [Affinirhizobium pseudoryzae]|uniref:5' DNA nuclease n=1 Tax=Allorhizobium pseudoryzae TaxID=379684 RepID=UPI0013EA25C8|nr:5' DNA nuclease [Allorhizobium pseudoryzae]